MFRELHAHVWLVRGLNSSFITIIPKCANPTAIEEFRPISLIGGLYKVVTKVLSYRLLQVLSEVICWNQYVFLGERDILDGVLVASEVVDEARKKKKKKKYSCLRLTLKKLMTR